MACCDNYQLHHFLIATGCDNLVSRLELADPSRLKAYSMGHPLPGGWGGIMQTNREEALRRMASIEGHLRGIRKMIEEDTYCVDILKQTYAVKRAIDKL